jgi:hypothetical protein
MDDIVKAAMAKWPDVPDCYGWLALDARGNWRMRDARCQALNLPGDIIRHPSLLNFINRNYQHDDKGQWCFQNGPQRVYVDLEVAPYICNYTADNMQLHVRQPFLKIQEAIFDEHQRLFLISDQAICLVDDRDLVLTLGAIKNHQNHSLNLEELTTWLESTQSTSLSINLPGIDQDLVLRKSSYDYLRSHFPLCLKPGSHAE